MGIKKNLIKLGIIASLLQPISIYNSANKILEYIGKEFYGYTLPEEMKTINSDSIEKTIHLENAKRAPLYIKKHYIKPFEKNTINKITYSYKETIKNINTIEEAMFYTSKYLKHGGSDIDKIRYGESDYWASFKKIHENKNNTLKRLDDCDGGAIAAAALLSDNGFPSYILIIKEEESSSHAVFVYKTNKNEYGSIGINKGDNNYPRYSLEGLIKKIGSKRKENYNKYQIFDIHKFSKDFISNNKNNDLTESYSKYIKIK